MKNWKEIIKNWKVNYKVKIFDKKRVVVLINNENIEILKEKRVIIMYR